jgi:hypothetical protein
MFFSKRAMSNCKAGGAGFAARAPRAATPLACAAAGWIKLPQASAHAHSSLMIELNFMVFSLIYKASSKFHGVGVNYRRRCRHWRAFASTDECARRGGKLSSGLENIFARAQGVGGGAAGCAKFRLPTITASAPRTGAVKIPSWLTHRHTT